MGKKRLRIKRAQKSDMNKVAEFIRSSAQWYKPFLDEKDYAEHEVGQEWIEKNYPKRDFYIGIEPENESKVGTISTQFFNQTTYLGYIYLDTDFVGKGYGHQLIDHAKDISKNKNQDEMILIAHPKAKWAVKAYEKYGFEKKSERREEILNYQNGLLKPYYEEGFHLYSYCLKQEAKLKAS